MLIDINDNPSVEANVEDGILKDELYLQIMRYILQRIRRKNHFDEDIMKPKSYLKNKLPDEYQ